MAENKAETKVEGTSAPEKAISKAPIRRLMKQEGAYLVAEEAVEMMVAFLEGLVSNITKSAAAIADKDGRKKITLSDVNDAFKA